jgi:vacuolar-type H+-ATPase subunit E/Vma4
MVDFRISWMFRLDLTKEEFRLVSKALRGTLAAADQPAALELQKKLLRERHKCLSQALNESQKAIDNIEAAESEDT